jgi:hypothetical protein
MFERTALGKLRRWRKSNTQKLEKILDKVISGKAFHHRN